MILFSSLLADGAHIPGHTRHNSDSEWLWGVVCAAEGGVRHAVVSAYAMSFFRSSAVGTMKPPERIPLN